MERNRQAAGYATDNVPLLPQVPHRRKFDIGRRTDSTIVCLLELVLFSLDMTWRSPNFYLKAMVQRLASDEPDMIEP